MLKKSLIGLGIGLGALSVCLILVVAGALVGGMAAYFAARSAAGGVATAPRPEVPVPETPEEGWQWPGPGLGPQAMPRPVWGSLNPVLVTEVIEDSPAEESGIEVGDIILGIDSQALNGEHDLAEIIREHDAGDDVELTILRGSDDTEILQLEVTLGENRNEEGKLVTYLGLWYRYLRSGMFVVPQSGGRLD
jgi:membrane-associated protease RseP (regulator of RpoE activity)